MKKSKRFDDYYEDYDDDVRNKKRKVREDKSRKAHRNQKNAIRSKSFDPVTYDEQYEND